MEPIISHWHSLKTRITVFTLAVFLLSIWSLSFYVSRTLQADMEQVLGEQQFSVVSAVAREVNDDLGYQLKALETVAKEMDADLLGSPAALQARLEQHPLLQLLFNGGVLVTSLEGSAMADVPRSANRIGINYMDREHVAVALREGKSSIGRPVMGKQLQTPVFSMAVPVRDTQGKVTGAIVGTTNLDKPSFLDKITLNPYGKTGGYFVISPKQRLVVTATDRSRVMQTLPAPGINPTIDRFFSGYEGYAVLVNAVGVRVLASSKLVPAADWAIAASVPTAEAFAPVRAMQERMFSVTLLLTVLTGALTCWVLRRQLAPLVATAGAMAALADSKQIPRPLAITQKGEIGQLVAGFNQILQTWSQRETALQESQQNLAITLNSIGDAVITTDTAGRITGMNPTAERLTAWTLADALGQPLSEVFRIISAETRLPLVNPVQLVMERGEVVGLANHTALLARDGCEHQIADRAAPIRNPAGDILGVVLVFSDITAKYKAEESLRLTRFSVEAAADGLFWMTQDGRFVDVNAGACRALGYTREELLQLQVWDVDTHFDAELWPRHFAELRKQGSLTFESEQRTKDGRLIPVEIVANYVKHGSEERNCAFVRDITERKRAQEIIAEQKTIVELILEQSLSGYWDWWIQKNEEYLSPTFKKMFGYEDHEMPNTPDAWQKIIFPEDLPGVLKVFKRHAQSRGEVAFYNEVRYQHKNGSTVWVICTGRVIEWDDQGQPVRMIGCHIDVTKIRQAQEKLQLAASVFTYAREGITITDLAGNILDVNEAFTRITGYSRDEAIGQNPRILQSGRQDRSFYAAMWEALTERGFWSGEIWNRRKSGEVYAEMLTISSVKDAAGTVLHYVALFADITADKEHQSQLEHMAHFDALTNLPNRLLLADRLQQAMTQAQRRGRQLAVAYLDLDGFKTINDRHGHELGDQVLIALASRMKDCLREGDTLARLGGDEFVAVLIDLEDASDSVPLLNRLLAAAALMVPVGELSVQVSASLGVTFYPLAQDIDADQLLRQADQAMYQAKLAGKNRYHVFDAVHDSSMRVQHESLERMRLALAQREFVLHYQPKVNMHSGTVIGAEALIRWQHPERGLLAPAAFLHVIEDHPLAVEVGEWVIDAAMQQMETWHAAGLDLPVSVNIGARQLQQADFVARLQAIHARHPHVRPGCIELEILETSALADMVQVSKVIEDCAKLGVKFALDDFGTGYSSLTYLKRLRVATLKIDQSFVRDMLVDPDDLAILKGVIGLAAAFKREVIAEGVETIAHGTLLLQLGCELAQGYGIARPMPPEQMPAWAETWQADVAWGWVGDDLVVAAD